MTSVLLVVVAEATNPWVPAGLAGFSFMAVLGLLWKIQRGYVDVQDKRIALCSLETREAKLDLELSEWRMNQIIGHLRDHGIAVPDNIWTDMPAAILEQKRQLNEERAKLDA